MHGSNLRPNEAEWQQNTQCICHKDTTDTMLRHRHQHRLDAYLPCKCFLFVCLCSCNHSASISRPIELRRVALETNTIELYRCSLDSNEERSSQHSHRGGIYLQSGSIFVLLRSKICSDLTHKHKHKHKHKHTKPLPYLSVSLPR